MNLTQRLGKMGRFEIGSIVYFILAGYRTVADVNRTLQTRVHTPYFDGE